MKKLFLGVAAAAAMLGAAEPKVIAQLNNQDEFDARPQNITIKDGNITINSAGKSISIWNRTKKSFPVDAKKTYELHYEYRRVPGTTGLSPFYLGIVPLNADRKVISACSVNPVAKSDTVLAGAAKKGDKVLSVKDCSKWQKGLSWCNVAFNAKADLSDLPNNSYIPLASFEKKGDVWEVTLKKPLETDYPAGTAIRLQRDGAEYLYTLYTPNPPAEWTKGKYVFKGVGKREYDGFRPGTKTVQLFIGVLSKPCAVEIRNYKLIEL